MSTYPAPSGPAPSGQPGGPGQQHPALGPQRAAMLQLVAAGLGVLSFIWGFLTWYTENPAQGSGYIDGYALGSAATAGIALSILAGAIALGYALDGRTSSAVPLAVAGAAVLMMIGVTGARDASSLNGSLGMGVGMILGLATAVVQLFVLLAAWLLGTGRVSAAPRGAAHPGYPVTGYGQPQYGQPPIGQQPYGSPYAGPPQERPTQDRPGGFGPTTSYGSGMPAQPTTELPRAERPEQHPPG